MSPPSAPTAAGTAHFLTSAASTVGLQRRRALVTALLTTTLGGRRHAGADRRYSEDQDLAVAQPSAWRRRRRQPAPLFSSAATVLGYRYFGELRQRHLLHDDDSATPVPVVRVEVGTLAGVTTFSTQQQFLRTSSPRRRRLLAATAAAAASVTACSTRQPSEAAPRRCRWSVSEGRGPSPVSRPSAVTTTATSTAETAGTAHSSPRAAWTAGALAFPANSVTASPTRQHAREQRHAGAGGRCRRIGDPHRRHRPQQRRQRVLRTPRLGQRGLLGQRRRRRPR